MGNQEKGVILSGVAGIFFLAPTRSGRPATQRRISPPPLRCCYVEYRSPLNGSKREAHRKHQPMVVRAKSRDGDLLAAGHRKTQPPKQIHASESQSGRQEG